jgi:uncharacterized damage-inducible protein DinB
MTRPKTLFPYDAMWREIGSAYRALEVVRADLKETVDDLDQADLDRDPGNGVPSIGRLLCHAPGAEAWWILKMWRKEAVPETWKPVLQAGAIAKPGPSKTGLDRTRIYEVMHEVREFTRLNLMKTTDADLDRASIETPSGPATLRWTLFHLLEHEAHHRGQIALLRRIYGKPLHGGG